MTQSRTQSPPNAHLVVRPRCLAVLVCLAAVAGTALGDAPSALAKSLCVDKQPGCFAAIQAAVNAARDGDTISIARGTYEGAVTIDVSVKLVGAGARRTMIRGGSPPLTIGTFGASSEPTVSIDGVTITRGVTRSSPESTPFAGEEGVFALGGGVEIPPNADFSGGADVTITNSVITRNRVAPDRTQPVGPPCPDGPCPFALAAGGGIDSWGTLTLAHTTISRNRVGSASGLSTLASDTQGGAIMSWLGPVTIRDSVINDNRAGATAPNGRFADGGAILVGAGALTMRDSSVTGNSADLAASLPDTVDLAAIAGGIHISSDASTARISGTSISRNSVAMTNDVGDATAFSGGLLVDLGVDFRLSNSVIAENRVSSATLRGSTGDAEGDTGGAGLLGTIVNTRLTGNGVIVSAEAGDATAAAGGSFLRGSLVDTVARDNEVRASSLHGAVNVAGGALVIDEGGVTLRNTTVTGNAAHAHGRGGIARGGGIFDGPLFSPGGPLTLVDSSVTHNRLTGNSGTALQGGGVYIRGQQATLTNSVIAGNIPDDCFGCQPFHASEGRWLGARGHAVRTPAARAASVMRASAVTLNWLSQSR